jgi:pyruvate-formate lyase-activating enzyme
MISKKEKSENRLLPITVLNSTTAHCIACGQSHTARIEQQGNAIFLRVFCPEKETRVQVSSDAATFIRIREKSTVPYTGESSSPGFRWTYVVEITNDCNFSCPVCFNSKTRQDEKTFLPAVEIVRRAMAIRDCGRKSVYLTGGEPTCHPELPAIIQQLARKGFKVAVATNGLKTAHDPDYVRQLKQAGVHIVWLTFTALDEQVYQTMRGGGSVAEMKLALANLLAAGIRVGINYTATSINLPDLEEILCYFVTLPPGLCVMHIGIAAPVGTYNLDPASLVDRETVINALADMELFQGRVSSEDFWPPPAFKPWGPGTHPDCSANLYLLSDQEKEQYRSFTEFLDFGQLYRKLQASNLKPGFITKNLVPLFMAFKTLKPGSRKLFFRHLYGLLTGRGCKGVFLISITSFISKEYQDDQRLQRCAIGHLTPSGRVISPCIYNYPERMESMYSREDRD